MKIIIASSNKGKIAEFKRMLTPLGFEAVSQLDAGIDISPKENGKTFEENAAIKAREIYKAANMPCIADDSGLCVDCLNGAPGVYTSRFAGENATDEENINKLLCLMEGVEPSKRTAKFVSVIHMIFAPGDEISVRGECKGSIGFEKIGTGGFGYDPVFMINDKSIAELSPEHKDAVSHRGQALLKLVKQLESRK